MFCVCLDVACPGIVLVRMPSVRCLILSMVYVAFISLLDFSLGSFICIWHFPSNLNPCYLSGVVCKQTHCQRLLSNQPKTQSLLWSSKVFIITDITWLHTCTSQYSSQTAGHWVVTCLLATKTLSLIRIQFEEIRITVIFQTAYF